jgi:hypothetical protein
MYFRQQALAFFERARGLRKEGDKHRQRIMAILSGDGLFGFEEPEPTV